MNDERYRKIMSDLGMPNSRSLLQALQQVANEVGQQSSEEITRLRADLAKVTWQRNEAQAGLAAMTKSRDAAMRIVTAKDQQMSVLRTQQDQWSEARNTLESERAANARITADLAASQAECERLREALDYVIRDLGVRSHWKRGENKGVVDIGDGAYTQAKAALAGEVKP